MNRFIYSTLFVFVLSSGTTTAQSEQTPGGLPLLFEEDFEAGMDRWEFTDDGAWRLTREENNQVLELFQASDYQPPYRSPENMALLKDLWVSDFVLEARLKSTSRQYNHRDLCLFFGWRSPASFYYAHLAPVADPNANSIFLVNNQPRVSIALERTDGTRWEDGRYHTLRVTRSVSSGRIEVFFDDMQKPVMTAVDKNYTTGRIGLGSFDDTGLFSEVRIWGRRAEPHLSDEEVVALYQGLRVADVSDGMDAVGLADSGLVDPRIQPLWKDTVDYQHRIVGVAVTVRYVPTNRTRPAFASEEEFHAWEGDWYQNISPEPFVDFLKPGSVVMIDGSSDGDTGTIGSNNILFWKSRGAVGVITSGGARDTDEIIAQKVPLYFGRPGRGIRPGRNEVESVNQPIEMGGVMVRPGDVVVADGDGVIVVPRERALTVAQVAKNILDSDKAGRLRLYEQLGIPLDKSVKP